ncbi:MAG: protein kinase, partial [Defluviitaleaceae bacterium]|nr:protein kinase [Defluviitaleaceae bacterium]
MILNPGQIIAFRYEIIEEIGSGGMSIVYRARDTKLFRDVSLKVMRPEHMESEEFIDRFHTEARAIASLNHANIVNVYDVGNEDGINFIVMEYVDGSTLKELINKKAPFNDISMLGVANQIAIALAHAHEAGIVHRDIKPQNILVMNTGVVKVTDFGIAVSARANARRNSEDDHGTTMGSVHYISPEQACNDPVDPRSDLYSLGIVMYEMMTGDLPFDGESAEDIAAMHIETKLPDLRQFNPETDEAVIRLIKTLTNKLPERRYQTAAEAAAIMQMAMTNSANTPDAPEAEPIAEAPPAPPIRRRPPRPIMRP